MDVKIFEKSENKIVVEIDDINPAFANSLRRVLLNEIPVLAIEDVDVIENTSGFYDEGLAHRLGLIPLKFSKLNLKDECKCNGKGCSNCQVSISLDKKGPCVIKASDLIFSSDAKPIDPDIPIAELLDEQKVKLEATAMLGVGRDHAKWQPAVVGYRYVPIVKIKDKSDIAAALKACPQGVFVKKDNTIGLSKPINCDLCMRCAELCEGISVSQDDTKFIFTIESVCGLSAEELFLKALDILEDKSKDFVKAVKSVL
ncbi:MAG: DNA-directed RNA polymerase subunit D [Candidatus Aenigmarchaeota archaeon]|nr:DNA-directed RNA polymerase subunit D [Candidatus Aenigmarchaeota archaeon]